MSARAQDRALDQFRAALARQSAVMEKHWHAALSAADPEALHDLRVAVRRTRALLANAVGVIPRKTRERFGSRFRDLARATTATRDLDVLALDWPQHAERVDADLRPALAPVHAELVARQRAALETTRGELLASESAQLLVDWRAWLDGKPDYKARRAKHPLQRVVWRRLRRLRKRLERRSTDLSVEGRHEWRKDAKELRYLLEAFAERFKDKRRHQLLTELVAAQDSLGRQRDALVQVGLINAIATEPHLSDASKAAAAQLTARLLATSLADPDPRRGIARRLKRRLRTLRN